MKSMENTSENSQEKRGGVEKGFDKFSHFFKNNAINFYWCKML